MQSQSTRRFELGLPLFETLDMGLLLEADVQIKAKDPKGLSTVVAILSKASRVKAVRKLAAIWVATEVELKAAEEQPRVMAELEEIQANRPFKDVFNEAMSFYLELLGSLGITVVLSEAAPEIPEEPAAAGDEPPSDGSPSEG
jgi:hypothetical protein